MTEVVDTNVIVRHFVGNPPAQARRASALLLNGTPGQFLLLDVHVAETVHVLEGPYGLEKNEVALLIGSMLGVAALSVERPERVARAVDLYAHSGMDFADAYLVAAAEELGVHEVVSFDRFDRKLVGASKIVRREP